MDHSKLIDKIRKLLAMATSANEIEAAAFAAKAQALLAEHNIDPASVAEADEPIFEKDGSFRTNDKHWARKLCSAAAKLYFCGYAYWAPKGETHWDTHYFIGERHNIVVAKLMSEYLVDTVTRLSNESGAASLKFGETAARYRHSFCIGCTDRLVARMWDRYQAARAGQVKSETTGTTLPALANEYDKATARLKQHMADQAAKAEQKLRASSGQGLAAGAEAAEGISLDSQVGPRRPDPLLTQDRY